MPKGTEKVHIRDLVKYVMTPSHIPRTAQSKVFYSLSRLRHLLSQPWLKPQTFLQFDLLPYFMEAQKCIREVRNVSMESERYRQISDPKCSSGNVAHLLYSNCAVEILNIIFVLFLFNFYPGKRKYMKNIECVCVCVCVCVLNLNQTLRLEIF